MQISIVALKAQILTLVVILVVRNEQIIFLQERCNILGNNYVETIFMLFDWIVKQF